jgi:hypothetical protein
LGEVAGDVPAVASDDRFRCSKLSRYFPQRSPAKQSPLDLEALRVAADCAGLWHGISILAPGTLCCKALSTA